MNPSGLTYTSPNTFTAKQRLALRLVPPLAALSLKALCMTCSVEIRGGRLWNEAIERGDGVLLAIWHEVMGCAAYCFRNSGAHTLTSYSFDGEMAARVIGRFGLRAVRGSSSRGGLKALSQLKKATGVAQIVGLTLDGPHGPRRVAKPGIAVLAATTQQAIYPWACAVNRAWRLNSWDRFAIPKPFARMVCAFGPPIPPPPRMAADLVEATRLQVEEGLEALYREIETDLSAPPRDAV